MREELKDRPEYRSFDFHFRFATSIRARVKNLVAPIQSIDPERVTNLAPPIAIFLNGAMVRVSLWNGYFRTLFWTRDLREEYVVVHTDPRLRTVLRKSWIAYLQGLTPGYILSSQAID